jgi:hypothetical protein
LRKRGWDRITIRSLESGGQHIDLLTINSNKNRSRTRTKEDYDSTLQEQILESSPFRFEKVPESTKKSGDVNMNIVKPKQIK